MQTDRRQSNVFRPAFTEARAGAEDEGPEIPAEFARLG